VRDDGIAHASTPAERNGEDQAGQNTYHPVLAMHQAKG
jgi:hypothetical protein